MRGEEEGKREGNEAGGRRVLGIGEGRQAEGKYWIGRGGGRGMRRVDEESRGRVSVLVD